MTGPVERQEWEGRDLAHWRRTWGVPLLRVFQRIGSTMDLAAALADDGAPEGAVVLADEQTAGRGRRGRAWTAPPGSLSLSMVIRPLGPDTTRLLTVRLGLAAARALEAADVRVTLKWPNDLVVGGRKVAGILCESSLADDRVAHVIAGIGVNLHQRDDDWPAELAGHATSLTAAGGHDADAAAVAGAIITEWLDVIHAPRTTLSATEHAEFQQRDALRGLPVTIDGEPAGTAQGITPHGALRVRHDHHVREVIAGTVRTPNIPDPGGRP